MIFPSSEHMRWSSWTLIPTEPLKYYSFFDVFRVDHGTLGIDQSDCRHNQTPPRRKLALPNLTTCFLSSHDYPDIRYTSFTHSVVRGTDVGYRRFSIRLTARKAGSWTSAYDSKSSLDKYDRWFWCHTVCILSRLFHLVLYVSLNNTYDL